MPPPLFHRLYNMSNLRKMQIHHQILKIHPNIVLTTDRKLGKTNHILMLDLTFDQGSRSNRGQLGLNFPQLMIIVFI